MTEVSSQNPATAAVSQSKPDVENAEATPAERFALKQARATRVGESGGLKSARPRRRSFRIVPVEDETPTWRQRLLRSIASGLGIGFGASTIVHIAAIVVFAFWIFEFERFLPVFALNAGVAKEGIEVELDSDQPINLAETQGGPAVEQPTLLRSSEFVTRNMEVDADVPADLESRINLLAGKDAGDGKTKGAGNDDSTGAVPKGGARVGKNAVTKGKFTVWSVPANPDVQQSYLIGIRVQLPPDVKRFRIDDLTGSVSGDLDGHRQRIPHDPNWGPPKVYHRGRFINLNKKGYVPVRSAKGKKFAIIYIWVPGSEVPKTTDTVQIRSKMLKDEQRLKIVF